MDKRLLGMPVAVLCLLVVFLIMCNPFVMVGPGERGIKITMGKVQQESYGEGLHLIFPFVQKFRTMDVKTQRNTKTTAVYTKDIQQARITYVLNYNVEPSSVNKLFQEVGLDYETKILIPVVEGTIKDIIGKWNAQDLIANREKATEEIDVKKGIIPNGIYTLETNIRETNEVIKATMQVEDGKIILKSGSQISSSLQKKKMGWMKDRSLLKIENNIIIEDYVCTSPSMAAAIVTGHNKNGWVSWKNSNGDLIDIYRTTEEDKE